MDRISMITKRDILDLFRNGIDIDNDFFVDKVKYSYFGRMEELDFLKRIYDVENMPSSDPRYENAEGDIIQHTVNNDDYSFCWVFEDERFPLCKGNDEEYLKFICEIFHPEVRVERSNWKEFFNAIKELLRKDGYDLYPAQKISGRDVFGWKIYSHQEDKVFIPFSQRNAVAIKERRMTLSIPRDIRNQLYKLLERYNENFYSIDETGWNQKESTIGLVFSNIRKFYVPKCYNENNQYVETDNLQIFLNSCKPTNVFDVLEIFAQNTDNVDFVRHVDEILSSNKLPYKFDHGKIISIIRVQAIAAPIKEAGLEELIQEAAEYYQKGNRKIAVEKIWDAFERLKTYYGSAGLDKKESATKIVENMSNGDKNFYNLFDEEFKELTKIGNNFCIRHHETNKMDIKDNKHYDYLYNRCLSLLSAAVDNLE